MKIGNPLDAIKNFESCLKINRMNAQAIYNKGLCLIQINKFEEAIFDFSLIIKENPEDLESYYNKGICLLKINKIDEALAQFNKILQINKNYLFANLQKGICYSKLHKFDKALNELNYYEKNSKNENKNYELNYHKGLCYMNNKQYNFALEEFNNALRLDPNNAEALTNRALVYSELGKTKEATADRDAALKLNPNLIGEWIKQGDEFFSAKDYSKAIECYEKAIQLDPNNSDAYKKLGKSYREKSKESFAKARQLAK